MTYLPDPQRVLDRGEASEALLRDPLFLAAMNDASDYHLAAMVTSQEGPAGMDAREHHHRMLQAHREIVDQLRLYVAAADEINARAAQIAADDAPPTDEPENTP